VSELVWQVGNRNPSITENIVDADGNPFDLTSKTVTFSMRPVGSSTPKVNAQSAVIVNPPGIDGLVRYDWQAGDVDTEGEYLVWWTVTSGTKTQDVAEALVAFRAHAPERNTYVELEEFKQTSGLTGTSFADSDILGSLVAASRAVDAETGRRFYLDSIDQTRYYSVRPRRVYSDGGSPYDSQAIYGANLGYDRLQIEDLATLTTLQTAPASDAVFSQTWVAGTDYVLEPRSAVADGVPYTEIRALATSRFAWPFWPDSIAVTGRFGWPSVPENVKIATALLAGRLLKLKREAPFGVIGFGADGFAVRVSRQIPDWDLLLSDYSRRSYVR